MSDENKLNALKLIVARSTNAMQEALRTIQAITVHSPVAQRRYNYTAELALNDESAEWTPEERQLIASEMDLLDSAQKFGRPPLYEESMRQTSIYLPDEMLAWLNDQPDGMSETIRKLIQQAMGK